MRRRHPQNPNLRLYDQPYWKGYPVIQNRGPLIVEYLEQIDHTLINALLDDTRVSVLLAYLRLPSAGTSHEDAFISRFSASLKAQIAALEGRKRAAGKRVYPCHLRVIWVRERAGSENSHFHVAIIVNKDAFYSLGDFRCMDGNMSARINKAVASALSISLEDARGLAHFPEHAVYHLDANSEDFQLQRGAVFRRLSYFAKVDTKHYGTGTKNFGCSRS